MIIVNIKLYYQFPSQKFKLKNYIVYPHGPLSEHGERHTLFPAGKQKQSFCAMF